jgi:beta-mannosidase
VLSLRLADPAGGSGQEVNLAVEDDTVRHTFTVEQPALWWPRGYGEQPRYTVTAALKEGEEVVDRRQLAVGLRDLRLVQQRLTDAPGASFMFVCNGAPLFCGGANWIPADSLLNRIPPERYRALLQIAAEADMTMLRVWGGGVYEDDIFYDTCDELGLLIWQDFMFACGMYPADPAFQQSVRAEAEAVVRRLRHHPCLSLWCGNNEDYQVAESTRAYRPDTPGDPAAFPGRILYEQVLPEVCARLDPAGPTSRAAPMGGPGR